MTKVVVLDDDLEIKPAANLHDSQGKQCKDLNDLLLKYSDWHRLQRAVAWMIMFKDYLSKKYLRKKCSDVTVKHN